MPTPVELAKAKLFEYLDATQKESYEKYGIIKVTGRDGKFYYISTDAAMAKYTLWRITLVVDGLKKGYCIDIPLLGPEKVLVLKLLLEAKPEFITSGGIMFDKGVQF